MLIVLTDIRNFTPMARPTLQISTSTFWSVSERTMYRQESDFSQRISALSTRSPYSWVSQQKHGFPDLPFSSDLKPTDIYFHSKIIIQLSAHRFSTVIVIQIKWQKVLRLLPENDFKAGFPQIVQILWSYPNSLKYLSMLMPYRLIKWTHELCSTGCQSILRNMQ